MASSNKGKEVESSARLRKRQHQGSSHAGSLTSENTQNDEHLAEVYQSPVSGFI
jgi:dolichyl-phosphate-mannose-protein mannosyltransferase